MTSHPLHMTRKLVETMPRLAKVCPHVNLPVQSGDDEVLRRMKRGYTAQRYRELVASIRAALARGLALNRRDRRVSG